MSSREVAWVCVGVALVGACQGAAASDLFDTNAVIDGDASVGGDSQTPTTSSSSSGDAASTSSSSGGSTSGAPDAAPDAPAVDLDPSGVYCSALVGYCSGAAPLCCAGRPAQGPGPDALGPYECKAACAAAETIIDCDDNDDCAGGEVCCVTNNAEGTPQAITCKAVAACPPGDSQTTVCDPAKAETCGTYNPGTTCKPFGNLDTGYICIP